MAIFRHTNKYTTPDKYDVGANILSILSTSLEFSINHKSNSIRHHHDAWQGVQ